MREYQRGFTYLWVLLATAVIGIGLVAASEVWVASARRQKLDELEWIGDQFVRAIGSYRGSVPGRGQYPSSLEELLEDRRFAVPRRHLRRLYLNPFTAKNDWLLIKSPDGKVLGVAVDLPVWAGAQRRQFVVAPGVDPVATERAWSDLLSKLKDGSERTRRAQGLPA